MPDKPLEGTIVGKAAGAAGKAGKAVSGAQALTALQDVVGAGRDYLVLRQQEMTKREVIHAYEVLETRRIKAAEAVLTNYFNLAFAERASNFQELLARLDAAAEAGDTHTVSEALKAIIAIAQTSPLNDLGDLSQIRGALDDPDHVWEL